MQLLNTNDPDFDRDLENLLDRESEQDRAVEQSVLDIISRVRSEGDAAVLELTRQFDQLDQPNAAKLELSSQRLQQAL